ncbi:U-box domain-containing protein 17 [Raphanus sativus]|nr:U-box domain-containing protein 17 [Raphanus sativus]
MATAAIFSSLRRRRSPCGTQFSFQRRNARSLIRKIEIFLVLFESLTESRWGSSSSSTALLCLKELYLLLYRSKILLDYVAHSSKLWLILQTQSISGYFHDLNQEVSTLLDVFPLDLALGDDVREQIELLQHQSRRSRLYVDSNDESLRVTLYSFLDGFENGEIPNKLSLRTFFVERLGIRDSKSCGSEIEFLEEQIANHYGDVEPTGSVINGFVAITRYCRFLLFEGFKEEWRIKNNNNNNNPKKSKGEGDGEGFITVPIPKDFVCPISLDLMTDPVIIPTGQTYDRTSIARRIEEGHCTCPKTGQMLADSRIVPNRALKNLILQWCAASGVCYESKFVTDSSSTNEGFVSGLPTKAAVEANKATVSILIEYLADGSEAAQTVAAREIRLLAKTGKENREFIAEARAIPHLRRLLESENVVAQEKSVTAMLNLSIYERNKSRIMEEEECLEAIVSVLVSCLTVEAQENAADSCSKHSG